MWPRAVTGPTVDSTRFSINQRRDESIAGNWNSMQNKDDLFIFMYDVVLQLLISLDMMITSDHVVKWDSQFQLYERHIYLRLAKSFKFDSINILGFHPFIILSMIKASPRLRPSPTIVPTPPVATASNTSPAPVKNDQRNAFPGILSTHVSVVTAL